MVLVSSEMIKEKPSLLERFVPILLLVVVALAFFVGVLWQKVSTLESGKTGSNVALNNGNKPTVGADGKVASDIAKKIARPSKDEHIKGSANAKVFLITYTDLQCPYCSRFHATAEQVLKDYGDKIALVYRNFPLEVIHPMALSAAKAAECVAKLSGNDAYWKFVSDVFSAQANMSEASLEASAVKQGVKKTDYASCIASDEIVNKVKSDVNKGSEIGVNGTPATFVLNGKGEAWQVPGAVPLDSLKTYIDASLK